MGCLFNKCLILYKTKNFKESLVFLDKCLEIYSEFINACYTKYLVLKELGKDDDADKCYLKYLELANKNKF